MHSKGSKPCSRASLATPHALICYAQRALRMPEYWLSHWMIGILAGGAGASSNEQPCAASQQADDGFHDVPPAVLDDAIIAARTSMGKPGAGRATPFAALIFMKYLPEK